MELGLIGIGKMGYQMTLRLLQGKHRVIVYDLNSEAVKSVAEKGAIPATSLANLINQLHRPRSIWIMVPAGKPTEEMLNHLMPLLDAEDIIIDGGNSYYKDTLRRAKVLNQKRIHLVDAGTSGGIWGLAEGYSIMVGGEKEIVEKLTPIFQSLAPALEKGWGYVGPTGAGHFVKMVHNGIEYGLMQAYAEGFALLKKKPEFALDLNQIADIWQDGSVIRSWLLDLTAKALKDNPELIGIAPYVADSGEGRWTVAEAIELDVPAPVITLSLINRLQSRDADSFTDKLLAAMRNQFGGHAVKPVK
jgi:6-phosphogluconate dehydrogenase